MNDAAISKGMLFESVEDARIAIKNFSLRNSRPYILQKSEPTRVVAVRHDCSFRISITKQQNGMMKCEVISWHQLYCKTDSLISDVVTIIANAELNKLLYQS